MSVSLAQILERKRQEELGSQQNMIQGVTQGQQQAKGTAAQLTQNKRDKEAKEFNPINALVSGGTAFVASGGNPVAAGVAALGSSRGKKIKPLESVVKGGTTGISQGATSLTDLAKPENADKLALAAKQSGAPKSVVSGLEAYSKLQTVKSDKEAKATATKSKSDAKIKSDKLIADSKVKAAKVKASTDISLAKVKGDITAKNKKKTTNSAANKKKLEVNYTSVINKNDEVISNFQQKMKEYEGSIVDDNIKLPEVITHYTAIENAIKAIQGTKSLSESHKRSEVKRLKKHLAELKETYSLDLSN